jgi:hypothetical protein
MTKNSEAFWELVSFQPPIEVRPSKGVDLVSVFVSSAVCVIDSQELYGAFSAARTTGLALGVVSKNLQAELEEPGSAASVLVFLYIRLLAIVFVAQTTPIRVTVAAILGLGELAKGLRLMAHVTHFCMWFGHECHGTTVGVVVSTRSCPTHAGSGWEVIFGFATKDGVSP